MIRDWTIMGIVNVTPDSFSDGGLYVDADKAIAHGLSLIADGAAILDIGGESTKPGATPVMAEEEIARIRPVIEGLTGQGARLSVDTRHARTMQAALDMGVEIINDISALSYDIESFNVLAPAQCDVILMHMQGTPQTMQAAPHYEDVVREVYDYLAERIDICIHAGIGQHRIMIDPGIGFGKTLEHNLKLLNNLDKFATLGARLVLGTSRKRFIEGIHPGAAPGQRIGGSVASVLSAYQKGVRIFRVHDVYETDQALLTMAAISQG